MDPTLNAVLTSVVPVFGLVVLSALYSRRFRPDYGTTLRITAQIFIPCLVFTSVLRSNVVASEVWRAAAATWIQIGTGLLIGFLVLTLLGWRERRELLLPISFVNSANLPLPIVFAQFGPPGMAYAVICFLTTSWTVFTVGTLILHGRGRMGQALREPVLYATFVAFAFKLSGVRIPEPALRVPELAGQAAIPLMLVMFGDALARARAGSVGAALVATLVRYGSAAVALFVTLRLIQPEGMLRTILVLYAFLPSAVVNVVLTQKAGRDASAVASTVLGTTLVAVVLIPLILTWLIHGGP